MEKYVYRSLSKWQKRFVNGVYRLGKNEVEARDPKAGEGTEVLESGKDCLVPYRLAVKWYVVQIYHYQKNSNVPDEVVYGIRVDVSKTITIYKSLLDYKLFAENASYRRSYLIHMLGLEW